jgi:hypothetical protein
MSIDPDVRPITDITARLEQQFIEEYIRQRGHTPGHLEALGEADRRALLRDATKHAAAKLAEVESRAHYIREIHGER